MSHQWLRLWHDMPNDPKFRTIARASKQRIGDVIAIFVHLLVDASSNEVSRGVTQCNAEDVASALDMETEDVIAVLNAMQGRVLDGNELIGWARRQPKREDDSLERVRKHRENNKMESVTQRNADVTQGNATVTQRNAPDKDKDTDTDTEKDSSVLNLDIELHNKHTNAQANNFEPAQAVMDAPLEPGGKGFFSGGDCFFKFWTAIPNQFRDEQSECLAIWRRLKLDSEAERIIADIQARAVTDYRWREQINGESSVKWYLHHRRWNNRIIAEPPKPKTRKNHHARADDPEF